MQSEDLRDYLGRRRDPGPPQQAFECGLLASTPDERHVAIPTVKSSSFIGFIEVVRENWLLRICHLHPLLAPQVNMCAFNTKQASRHHRLNTV